MLRLPWRSTCWRETTVPDVETAQRLEFPPSVIGQVLTLGMKGERATLKFLFEDAEDEIDVAGPQNKFYTLYEDYGSELEFQRCSSIRRVLVQTTTSDCLWTKRPQG